MEQQDLSEKRRDPTMKNIEHDVAITSVDQILALDIIDWNRLNGYWTNPAEALHDIASVLVNGSAYSIWQTAFHLAPARSDWPGWSHPGQHVPIAQLFWNWFFWKKKGTLAFADAPDFSGTLVLQGKRIRFWGDIGKASPITFLETLKQMDVHDIWIILPDAQTQIVLEANVSFRDLWSETVQALF
jgi:hypothetical protein